MEMEQMKRQMEQLEKQINNKKEGAIVWDSDEEIINKIQQMERIKENKKEQMEQMEKQISSTMDNGTSETNPSSSIIVQNTDSVDANKTNSASDQKSKPGNIVYLLYIVEAFLRKNMSHFLTLTVLIFYSIMY